MKNELCRRIAELSKKAHELVKYIHAEEKPDYCRRINAGRELKSVERN